MTGRKYVHVFNNCIEDFNNISRQDSEENIRQ